MHPLQNGTQVEVPPELKPTEGDPGYFAETGQPSIPGADWFNACIKEFQNALSAKGIKFVSGQFDHFEKLLESVSFDLSFNIVTFTASATYTPSPNVLAAEVIIVGGGGGGAGSSGNSNDGGGAGGGCAIVYLSESDLKPTSIIIGAGGAGGSTSWGGTAGDTSFGDVTATGGRGGPPSSASANGAINGGSGNGDINIPGQGATHGSDRASGAGGSSYLSGGAPVARNENGHSGQGPGAGGSGASSLSTTSRSGGDGHDGIVIIKEYLK
ncbi:glycine-rich domain-containing protein [Vibrio paucivorans]